MLIILIFILQINFINHQISSYPIGNSDCGVKSWDCTGINTYRICSFGRFVGDELTCPGNKICNISNPKICHEPNYRVQMALPRNQYPIRQSDVEHIAPKIKKKNPYCLTKINYELYTRLCKVEIMKRSKFTVYGTGCTTFVDCEQRGAGFVCPTGTFFNGKVCDENYICPEPCEPVPEQLQLKNVIAKGEIKVNSSEGRYPVMGSGCKFFVEWSVDTFGNLHGVLDQCPEASWFDPRDNRCKMRYYCPEFIGDEGKPKKCDEGVDHDICDPELQEPVCRHYGSIPIERSGCHFFAACETNRKKLQRCPDGTLFNPNTATCETGYECDRPCRPYSPKIFDNPFYQLKCYIKNGLRPLIGTNCKYYFKCINWIATVRKCPENSNFDPSENSCSSNYKCVENCVPRERDPVEYEEEYDEFTNSTTESFSSTTYIPAYDKDTFTRQTIGPNYDPYRSNYGAIQSSSHPYPFSTPPQPPQPPNKNQESFQRDQEPKYQNRYESNQDNPFSNFDRDNRDRGNGPIPNYYNYGQNNRGPDPDEDNSRSGPTPNNYGDNLRNSQPPHNYDDHSRRAPPPNNYGDNPRNSQSPHNYDDHSRRAPSPNYGDNSRSSPFPNNRDNSRSSPFPNNRDDSRSLPFPNNGDNSRSTPVPMTGDFFRSTPSPNYRDNSRTNNGDNFRSTPFPNNGDNSRSAPFPIHVDNFRSTPFPNNVDNSRSTPFLNNGDISRVTPFLNNGDISRVTPFLNNGDISRVTPFPNNYGDARNVQFLNNYEDNARSHYFGGTPRNGNQHGRGGNGTIYEEMWPSREPEYGANTQVSSDVEIEGCYAATPKEPQCEAAGKIAIPHTGCTRYVICLEITDNQFRRVEMICPKGKRFNPTKQECALKYICQEVPRCLKPTTIRITKDHGDLWAIPCQNGSGEKIRIPKCVILGVFSLEGTGCRQFYHCYNEGQQILQRIYTCPDNMLFNPHYKCCDQYYNCPTVDKCAPMMANSDTSVVIFNERYVCPENKMMLQVPRCVSEGMFDIPLTGCKRYYRCVLKDGKFSQTVDYCPHNHFFNPNIRRCLDNYVCLVEDKCGFDHSYVMKYKPHLEMEYIRK